MLKQQAKTAVLWGSVDVLLRQGLQFLITVTLSRILSPEEFGTAALLLLLTAIASAFVDGGFSLALIQRRDITHTDESTVFWFNLVLGATVSLAILSMGGLIAQFFMMPVLKPLTLAIALNVFMTTIGSIHATLLTKLLDFRTQAWISAAAMLISGLTGIIMALQGYGVWALVAQILVATTVNSITLWFSNQWRPAFVFSNESVRKLFGFGGYLMISALLEIIYSRIHAIFIGKFYGVWELGIYDRANSTANLPLGALTGVFSRIALPLFSAVAKDKQMLRRNVQVSIRGMMILTTPAMLGLALVSKPLILTIYGDQWLSVVPILQILCISGVLWPLHIVNLTALISQGYSQLFFRLEIIKKITGIIFLFAGSFFGIIGIATSQLVFSIFAFGINSHYSKKFLDYGALSQIQDFIPTAILTTIVMIAVYFSGKYSNMSPPVTLIIMTLTGFFLFFLLIFITKIPAFKDLYKMWNI